ncbi:MAG: 1-acyl-sn-glycerol-3-phosphate acyltransferase [Chloroflexi bacterium]|nr:MAG: hypothetical protein CUN54_05325 [Phototrophicales bacterium]RMF79597.1 MAG: 1-acyl-sn-glycerol-3-phosphate acyltransferase [Chloroflexota bacterium]
MSVATTIEEYVANQPAYRRKRNFIRNILIRGLGFKVLWRVTVTGLEHVPESGPTILMMNHISLIDPILCMGAITHRYVVPMAKVELAKNPIMKMLIDAWGAYYVNRGEVDRQALVNSIELAKSGTLILIAPEGTRHPEGLSRPKEGLTYVATKSDAVIVPAAISGAADWKQKLFRLQRPHIHVNFGRAFRFKTEGRRRIPRDEMNMMTEEAMYQLALAVVDKSKRGVYSDIENATTNLIEFVD